jgi:hypothetical protein
MTYSTSPPRSAGAPCSRPTDRDGRALHRVERAIAAAQARLTALRSAQASGQLEAARDVRSKLNTELVEALFALDELYAALEVPVGEWTLARAKEVSDSRRQSQRRKRAANI